MADGCLCSLSPAPQRLTLIARPCLNLTTLNLMYIGQQIPCEVDPVLGAMQHLFQRASGVSNILLL